MPEKVSIDFVDLLKRLEVVKDYSKFGLTMNPFPKAGIAPLFVDFTSEARADAIRRIAASIAYTYKSGRWSGILVIGAYGSGKSHTLKYMHHLILTQLDKLDEKAYSVYMEHPGSSFREFFGLLIDAIGDAEYRKLLSQTIKKLRPNLSLDETKLDDKQYLTEQANQFANSAKTDDFPVHRDLLTCAFVYSFARDPEMVKVAKDYLSGYTLGKRDFRALKLFSEELSEEAISVYAFPFLLYTIGQNGYKVLFLHVDEMERIGLQLTKAPATAFLENLRRLIDHNLDNFGMVCACAEDAWERLSRLNPGFMERMNEKIVLPNLNGKETKILIRDYLLRYRIQTYSGDELYPFEASSFEPLTLYSRKGVIRYILQNARYLLDEALLRGEAIDSRFVKKNLKAEG